MVSSEAESEGSVLSESVRHDTVDAPSAQSSEATSSDQMPTAQERSTAPISNDWKSVGNTSSLVSTRGMYVCGHGKSI